MRLKDFLIEEKVDKVVDGTDVKFNEKHLKDLIEIMDS